MATLVKSLSEIKPQHVQRITTTFKELDWQLGSETAKGLPKGKITVVAGARGVGKTRWAVELTKSMNQMGYTVLMFQGEVSEDQFVAEKMHDYLSPTFFVSSATALDEQLKIVEEVKPDLVIVDSVNTIDEYRGGFGAKHIVQGDLIDGVWHRGYREVIEKIGSHVIFISHLNAKGEFKGRTELPHYVDVEIYLYHYDKELTPAFFVVEVEKNRYGESGRKSIWCHQDWGVECQSTYSMPPAPRIALPPTKPTLIDRFKGWRMKHYGY
jgi:DNA repair protein RadA/Sms